MREWPVGLSLFVNNLFNVVYASGGGTITPSITPTSLIYGPPRTWGMRVRYGF